MENLRDRKQKGASHEVDSNSRKIEGNENQKVSMEIHQELTYSEIYQPIDNIWSLLFTTGYLTRRCRTDFADIQNKKECGGNRQWQRRFLRNWAANTSGKEIT